MDDHMWDEIEVTWHDRLKAASLMLSWIVAIALFIVILMLANTYYGIAVLLASVAFGLAGMCMYFLALTIVLRKRYREEHCTRDRRVM